MESQNSGIISRIKELLNRRDAMPRPLFYGIRALFLIIAPFLAFLLFEYGYRLDFNFFDFDFFWPNMLLYILILGCVYLLGQRSRTSIFIYVTFFLFCGFAYHFVYQFKAQPILPSDVLAAQTAASVAGAYSYELDSRLWKMLAMWFGYSFALFTICPRARMNVKEHVGITAIGIVVIVSVCISLGGAKLNDRYQFAIDNWDPSNSFVENGMLLTFSAMSQSMEMPMPYGYSESEALRILNSYKDADIGLNVDIDTLRSLDGYKPPTVITIMNESFADLARYPGMDDTSFNPVNCRQIMSESIVSGYALSSVYAGGTCNSEFEYLTDTSMAMQNAGYSPYVFQDFTSVPTLAKYFNNLDYHTCAIHPNAAENWRRDVVYPEMGFDEFLSIDHFEGAETIRGDVKDSSTYDVVLEQISSTDDPQYIFCVTMANHGGYDNPVDEEYLVDLAPAEDWLDDGQRHYSELLRIADADLKGFVDALRELDEPIVLCFFGDHQPNASSGIFHASLGKSAEEMTEEGNIAALEKMLEVPYFIWENRAMSNQSSMLEQVFGYSNDIHATDSASSLCYLGAQTAQATNLPLTPFMKLALTVHGQIPLLNQTAYELNGAWGIFTAGSSYPKILNEYAIASYYELHGNEAK